jgi:hypothetical protein
MNRQPSPQTGGYRGNHIEYLDYIVLLTKAVIHMWNIKKKSFDKLTLEMSVDVSRKYKNVSKHKRVLAPVIEYGIYPYINGIKLNEDEDEVFVVTEFFDSLTHQGKFPMFTCSCGIFGCGGFYVDVKYKKKTVIWGIEQSSYKEHIFTEENIVLIAKELIEKLTELNSLLQENGIKTYHDINIYREKLELFLNRK